MNDFDMCCACSPYGLLACKIVQQAIIDYRALLRGENRGEKVSFDEIRRFLLGQWCDDLLSFTEVNGVWVLNLLEKEAENVEKREQFLSITIDGRTATISEWCKEIGLSYSWHYKLYQKYGRQYVERRIADIKREKGL